MISPSSTSITRKRRPANGRRRSTTTVSINGNQYDLLFVLSLGAALGALPFLAINSNFYVQFYLSVFRQIAAAALELLSYLRHRVVTAVQLCSFSSLFLLLNLLILLIFTLSHFHRRSHSQSHDDADETGTISRNEDEYGGDSISNNRQQHSSSSYNRQVAAAVPSDDLQKTPDFRIRRRNYDIDRSEISGPAERRRQPMTLLFSPSASPSGSIILSPFTSRSLSLSPASSYSNAFFLNAVISVTEYPTDVDGSTAAGVLHSVELQELAGTTNDAKNDTKHAENSSEISSKTAVPSMVKTTAPAADFIEECPRTPSPNRRGAAPDIASPDSTPSTAADRITPANTESPTGLLRETTPEARRHHDVSDDVETSSNNRPLPSVRFKGLSHLHHHHHILNSSDHQYSVAGAGRSGSPLRITRRGSAKKGDCTLEAVWRAICEQKTKTDISDEPSISPAITQFSSTCGVAVHTASQNAVPYPSAPADDSTTTEKKHSSKSGASAALTLVQSPTISKSFKRRNSSSSSFYSSPCRRVTFDSPRRRRSIDSPTHSSSSTSTTASSSAVMPKQQGSARSPAAAAHSPSGGLIRQSSRSPSSVAQQQLRMSMRREPSMRLDELHARIESFISRFNHQIRLQREQSLLNYMDMQQVMKPGAGAN